MTQETIDITSFSPGREAAINQLSVPAQGGQTRKGSRLSLAHSEENEVEVPGPTLPRPAAPRRCATALEAEMIERARAVVTTRMTDPDLTITYIAQALGTTDDVLGRFFVNATQVRRFIRGVRLDAALLALASWPPTVTIIDEIRRAHGLSFASTFGQHFEARFGRLPSEVLAMRAVWDADRFRAWLTVQAERFGFSEALNRLPKEVRPDRMTRETLR